MAGLPLGFGETCEDTLLKPKKCPTMIRCWFSCSRKIKHTQNNSFAETSCEVFNSNMFNDDTLGKTELLALEAVPTGRWLRRIDQLQSSSRVAPAEGELEYEARSSRCERHWIQV